MTPDPALVLVVANTVIELVPIPPGRFVMGSPNDLFSEAPAHEVTIPARFFLGKYPVTQAHWQARIIGCAGKPLLGCLRPAFLEQAA